MAESGQCPACGRPFTAAEIAGYGILRARSARAGGPLMELPCQGCGKKMRLIPHGDGRYALPGQPPPAAVPEQDRRPPWVADGPAPSPPPSPEVEEPPVTELPDPDPEPVSEPTAPEPPPADGAPLSVSEALELLGVGPEAGEDELEQAFRQRSKTCHPDKVAHLDAEFQELAERKFKRLKRAFDLLRS